MWVYKIAASFHAMLATEVRKLFKAAVPFSDRKMVHLTCGPVPDAQVEHLAIGPERSSRDRSTVKQQYISLRETVAE